MDFPHHSYVLKFMILSLTIARLPAKPRDGFNKYSLDVVYGAEHTVDWLPVRPRQNTIEYVTNGENAEWGRHPSVISLQIYLQQWDVWAHYCGGVILNENIALSAAHCLVGKWGTMRFRVAAGWHRLEEGSNPYQQQREVERVIIHEEFTGSGTRVSDNDIAMLFLSEPLTFDTPYVQPGNIGTKYDDYVGKTCELVGWGRTAEFGDVPYVLQKADIPLITLKLCKQWWSLNLYVSVQQTHLCGTTSANGTKPLKTACGGDSGGPIFCDGIVAGLVSFGRRGCLGCTPDVYTEISSFWRWINFNRRNYSPGSTRNRRRKKPRRRRRNRPKRSSVNFSNGTH